jgi:predicted AlkP superfamily pyrophosphatase or phosphodiesterase
MSLVDTTTFKTSKLTVIVLDALGISTWKNSKDITPTLNKLKTINNTVIRSVMKSITPVNFATMLTGTSPEIHGITDREMTLRHETIFHVMREKGYRSATAARAKSSLGILISPHSDMPGLAQSNLDSQVVEIAISRLREGYNLVWIQLLDVDDAGHSYGPYSKESRDAVSRVDGYLKVIIRAAIEYGYSIFVLADHGQHNSDDKKYLGTHGTNMKEDIEFPFLWANTNELHDIFMG